MVNEAYAHQLVGQVSLLSLIVVAASAEAQQTLEFKHNESEHTTTVTTPTQQLAGKPLDGLLMKVVSVYEDQRPTKIKSIGLLSSSVADKARFETHRELVLVVDGKRVELGEKRLALVEDDSVRYMEGLYVTNLDMLVRLENASNVGGTIGGRRFVIREEHREAIKEFVRFFRSAKGRDAGNLQSRSGC
jgi:hypothetical protein